MRLLPAIGISASLHAAALGGAWCAGWLPVPGEAPLSAVLEVAWTGALVLRVLEGAPDVPAADETTPPAVCAPEEEAAEEAAPTGPGQASEPREIGAPERAPLLRTAPDPEHARPIPHWGGRKDAPEGPSAPSLAPGSPAPSACPKPPYPEEAVARGLEGVVLVRVEVLPEGRVGAVALLQSSGHASLDRAVLDWIPRRWGPFAPMRDREGRPVPGQFFDHAIRFRLSDF